jgi:hypothetical protein
MGKVREWLARVAAEAKTPPRTWTDAKQVKSDLQGIQWGLQCYFSLGGFKFRPKGVSEEDAWARTQEVLGNVTSVFMMIRCAEDVITRHGLVKEYQEQYAQVQRDVDVILKPIPEADQMAALRALVAAVNRAKMKERGQARVGIPGTDGGTGEPVDAMGVTLGDAEGESSGEAAGGGEQVQ